MLQRGEAVPHFQVTTTGGDAVNYVEIWQRRNLILVTLPRVDTPMTARYISDVKPRRPDFAQHGAALVMTRDLVVGVPAPGVLIADRWGEIVHIVCGRGPLPSASDLVDWMEYAQRRCPECEGESK